MAPHEKAVDWGQITLQGLIDRGLNAFAFELASECFADLRSKMVEAKIDPPPPKCIKFRLRTHGRHGNKLIEITVEEVE